MQTFHRGASYFSAILYLLFSLSLYGEDPTQRIRDLHERYRIDRNRAGICFTSLKTGQVVYRQNHRTPFVPASNMKLLTAFVALKKLGSDFTFHTRLYVDQNKTDKQSRNKKNLYIRGCGDPTISRKSGDTQTAVFERWAEQLKKQGHERISGDLYLDDSAYEQTYTHPSWSEYKHSFWYTAPVGALNYNDNCVLVKVVPRDPGRKANVSVQPEGSPVKIRNQTESIKRNSRAHIEFKRLKDTWTIDVSGDIATGTARREWITVPSPKRYFGSVVRHVFRRKNIPIQGETKFAPTPQRIRNRSADVKFTTPLTDPLKHMLKESQNLYAETILKQVAYKESGLGSWENASEITRNTLKQEGIPTGSCRFVDGSGLSRKNRLLPLTLVTVLRKWIRTQSLQPYISFLPVSGADGTMEHRLNKPPYRGNVSAKTGTLSNVKALTGIAGRENLREDRGNVILFSIILNQKDLPPGNARVFVDQVARVAHDLTDTEN